MPGAVAGGLGLSQAFARLPAGNYVAVQRSKCLLLLTIDGAAARNIKGLPAGRREKSASVGKGQHPVDIRSTSGPHPVDMPVEKWSTRGLNAGGERDDRNDDRRRRNDEK